MPRWRPAPRRAPTAGPGRRTPRRRAGSRWSRSTDLSVAARFGSFLAAATNGLDPISSRVSLSSAVDRALSASNSGCSTSSASFSRARMPWPATSPTGRVASEGAAPSRSGTTIRVSLGIAFESAPRLAQRQVRVRLDESVDGTGKIRARRRGHTACGQGPQGSSPLGRWSRACHHLALRTCGY